jgi:superfamily II DNA or RNA helicase
MERAVLANQLFVPDHWLEAEDLEPWSYYWTERCYEEEADLQGNLILDKYGKPKLKVWDEDRELKTYRNIRTAGVTQYVGIPRGNLSKVRGLVRDFSVDDIRSIPFLGFQIELNHNVLEDHRWPDQERCVSEWMAKGYGIVKGDTGSGKSLMGIGIMAKLGLQTIILSTLRDGREQWEDEIRLHTNINRLEKRLRRRLIGPLKRGSKPFPISTATLQTFLAERGRKDLVRLQDEFGLVLVDECQDVATPEYSRIVMSFNPFAFLGLTATEKRDDRGHLLMFDMLGPVVTESEARQMPPTVYFISTGISQPKWLTKKKFDPKFKWAKILQHIENSEDRYKVMMTYLHEDLDAGRIIVIVSQRRKIVKELYQRIRQDGYKVGYVDGTTRKRKEIYQSLFDGKIQCLCAGKVLNKLVNLPTVDCLHFVTPVASELATKQAYGRARRWLEGKKEPIIRDYVDYGGQLSGAFKKRMKLCKDNEWATRIVDENETRLARLSPWMRKQKKKK